VTRLSRKHRLEQVYGFLHAFSHLDDSETDILPGEGLSDAERWLRHELQVWVRLRLRTVVDEDADYLVVFERAPRKLRVGFGRRIVGVVGRGVGATDGADGDDDAVLVEVVELPELDETVRVRVPAVIRLYRVEQFPDFFGYAPVDGGELAPPPPLAWGSRQNRERSGLVWPVPSQEHELIGEMIQRGTQVMDRVPGDGTPHGIGGRRVDSPVDMPASLIVDFYDGWARATWKNTKERYVEFCCVELRPVHLDLYAVEAGTLPAPLPLRAHVLPLA
jgi:hypothetical protein